MTDNETPQTAWAIVVPPLSVNGSKMVRVLLFTVSRTRREAIEKFRHEYAPFMSGSVWARYRTGYGYRAKKIRLTVLDEETVA